jgi:hypothetical protein
MELSGSRDISLLGTCAVRRKYSPQCSLLSKETYGCVKKKKRRLIHLELLHPIVEDTKELFILQNRQQILSFLLWILVLLHISD